ncbi:hypothetical protein ATK78_0663 [Pedobacter metabolipauper]|uniref:Uncharacterized protein n=1 Tax=Pedobacter metabolipauper TaxID=425513 RepID=A0A4R6T1Z8_9SPHI|nr:hypothetical protein ATK78_0663 [Pedobacter metabolipauper]
MENKNKIEEVILFDIYGNINYFILANFKN